MDISDKALRPPTRGKNRIWDWIPTASVGYPDEPKAFSGNDSPREARRDQQIEALTNALEKAPNIKALLGTEPADAAPSQLAWQDAVDWFTKEEVAKPVGAAAPITGALAAAMEAARQVQPGLQAPQHGSLRADTTGAGPSHASQWGFPGPLTQGTFPGPLTMPGSLALQQALQKRLREQLATAVAGEKQPLDAQLLLMQAAGAQDDALASGGAFKDSDCWRPMTQPPSAASAASAATAGRHPPAIAQLLPNPDWLANSSGMFHGNGAAVPPPVPRQLLHRLQQQQQQQLQQQQQRQPPAAGGQQAAPWNTAIWARDLQMPVGNGNPLPGRPSAHVLAARRLLQMAAELPLPHRHRLLSLAAACPDFRPLFSFMAASASAQGPDAAPLRPAPVISMQPVPDMEAKIRYLLLKAREQVEGPTAEDSAASPTEAARSTEQAQAQGQQGLVLRVVSEYDVYGMCKDENVRAVVSLKAAARVAQRGHVALTCVLDRSGSMLGEPLRLVKETCHFLIDQLSDEDYLGIVSYASDVQTDLPLVRMTAPAKALAHVVVDLVSSGGSTALYDGLEAGLRQQAQAATKLAGSRIVHSCFLFTDGQASNGPRTKEEMLAALAGGAVGAAGSDPASAPVTVNTFGLGVGHSVDLLQAVAQAQGGVYYYIRAEADIAGGFGDALGGLLSVVAKDVRVSVTPVEGVALTAFRSGGRTDASASASAATRTATVAAMPTAMLGAAGSAAPASASAAVDIPTAKPPPATTTTVFNDMFAEEGREVLLELQLPKDSKAAVHNPMRPTHGFTMYEQQAKIVGYDEEVVDVADVVLEYTDVSSGLQRRESAVLRVTRCPGGRGPGVLPAEVVFVTALRFETIDAIEEAQRLAGQGGAADVTPAHSLLDTHMGRLRGSGVRSVQVEALVEQTRNARQSIRPRYQFTQDGVASVTDALQTLRQQRSTTCSGPGLTPASQAVYSTHSRSAYRAAASTSVRPAGPLLPAGLAGMPSDLLQAYMRIRP